MRNLILTMTLSAMLSGCTASTLDQEISVSKTYYVNATWYECCAITANGERFNPYGMTAAHKTYPFGTMLRVTNPDNGRSIVVRVNDRGPFTKGVDLDISKGGAQQLGIIKRGRAKVRVELIKSR